MSDSQIKSDPGWVPLVEAPIRLQLGSADIERKYGRTLRSSYYNIGGVVQVDTETDDGTHAVYIQYEDKNGAVGTKLLIDIFDYLGVLGVKRSIMEFAGENDLKTPERARQATEKVLRQAIREGRLRLRARESLTSSTFIDLPAYGLPELKITNWGKGWGRYSTGQEVFDSQVALVSDASLQIASDSEPDVPSSAGKNKRGRKTVVHWPTVAEELFRLMEENGDFTTEDPDWNAQARLEEKLLEFCARKFGKEPGLSTLQERLPEMLRAWKASRPEN